MPTMYRRSFLLSPSLIPAGALAAPQRAAAPAERRLLASLWPEQKLAAALLARGQWRHYPPFADRQAWSAIPAPASEQIVAAAAKSLDQPWESLPATLFLEYARSGNRSRYEGTRGRRRNRLRTLVVAECLEARGRFLDEILNGLWLTCEETYWGVPAHLGVQKAGSGLPDSAEPTIDLFAADTASLLAWTNELLGDRLEKISPLIRPRISREIEWRILEPFERRDDFWWMGWHDREVNNWNPWINSNMLTSVLLEVPDGPRRARLVHRAVRSLDRFLDAYHPDGGCDEGPSYWGHAGGSLFECLDLLYSATGGKADCFGIPLVQEIGRYIYKAHIDGDYFVNFADASARMRANYDLIHRYGQRIGDAAMQAFGAWGANRDRGTDASSIARQLDALFHDSETRRTEPRAPYLRDAWLPGIQVMVARTSAGSPEGLFVAAQGGHNAESHNHNDVGNFIVYAGGYPAVIDVGVDTYTAATFSSRRYEIWTMQSAFHNCPTINGTMQGAGRRFAARTVTCNSNDAESALSLDIAGAYPAEAKVESWQRTIKLVRREKALEVTDEYRCGGNQARLMLTVMTLPRPQLVQPGVVTLAVPAGTLRIEHDKRLVARVEEVTLEPGRLHDAWGDRVHRLCLEAPSIEAAGRLLTRISVA